MLGKLSLSAIPYHVPILVGTFIGVVIVGLAVLGAITYYGKWGVLFRNWLFSVDHKRIGIMYIVLALVMLFRGFADAIMMRLQQAMAYNSPGYLPPSHYDQIFTAHGTIMIFFMAMAFMQGLFNLIVPLQIGARDVAFPFINSLSFWLTTAGAILVNISLFIGDFSTAGWLAYPPVSELQFSPGVGVDYYIWAVQISGVGTLLTAVNFMTTVVKMRAPGMTWMRVPVFTWTVIASCIMIFTTFPALTVAVAELALDRYCGMHFFTNDGGGNVMLYLNLIWAWGHPEVYILVIPAFGVFSEVVPVFCKKPLFGYATMVYASLAITTLSLLVWVHHFFTMGAGANVNTFFGIMTMIIAIPTGVKVFNWLFTMFRGRIEFTAPMYWTIGFMIVFVIGGMTGVMLAIPASDFVLHNSEFLIAHFHNTIIGGVYFGYVAGMNFWAPKVTGFKMSQKLGKAAFFFWFFGFFLSFVPLYITGFDGMVRRLNHYDNPNWHFWLQIACVGVFCILCGVVCQLLQIFLGIINAKKPENIDVTGDPWDGRSLEWSTSSPAPVYNFAHIPVVQSRDAYAYNKEHGIDTRRTSETYKDILMPKNTSAGFWHGMFALVLGFAAVWHIWWLVIVTVILNFVLAIGYSFKDDKEYVIPASEVERIEKEHSRKLMTQVAE
ncbi:MULTISPECIES: cytochrome o ubiquinol oxidase subunit I [Commensalibacter]|uniref:cytochrome o ubiquinol oxidase subunit I n=1 Tax=Commensalibacter TaxID=1079922 RepID=UPI0012D9C7BC|nr:MULTISPECIES: cytochrome o ubiquinol oxidase subunit I [Commensalibacter]MBH9969433.1 cytochrome o ubiquinol oxidase subunit I [Commensalibacter sp. M0265]MBH9976788.1 cytochrome o ubiquinol oxidase subunit I [Commensalibacter sp. M0266]MBH9992275.1 cytochrome o ubiquinol oxidase subunit I [Commensalibacter sp. M0270]MBI0045964.1 cytochrome o ubiquinol oxidase subunit I [Commensalibacter sp. M0267]MBI0055633.1 cytochrome o ubiquinol oxidase subunit I [Commensalibacter sp. M0268]